MFGISIIINIFDDWTWCLRHNNMCRPPRARRPGRNVRISLKYPAHTLRNIIHRPARSPPPVTPPLHHSIIGCYGLGNIWLHLLRILHVPLSSQLAQFRFDQSSNLSLLRLATTAAAIADPSCDRLVMVWGCWAPSSDWRMRWASSKYSMADSLSCIRFKAVIFLSFQLLHRCCCCP